MSNYIAAFSKNALICVDANLGGEKGEEVTKILYDDGFANLYITTAFEASRFSHLTWIKGVVGKAPIFINDSVG